MVPRHPAAILVLLLATVTASAKDSPRDALWAAARNSDPKAVRAALDAGADVNAKNEIGVTALWIAASKGKLELVELLLDRGADVNARDGIWYQTPLSLSLGGFIGGGNTEVVKRLVKAGAKDVDAAAQAAAARGNVALLQLMLDTGKVTRDALDAALHAAPESRKEVREALTKAGAKPLPPADPKDRESWAALAGTYENDNATSLAVKVTDAGLSTGTTVYRPAGPDRFVALGNPDAGLALSRGSSSGGSPPKPTTIRRNRSRSRPPCRPKVPPRSRRRWTGRSSAVRTPPASPTASTRRPPGT
jgi:hypothetical protein